MHLRSMSAAEAARKVLCLLNLPYNLDELGIGRVLQARGLNPVTIVCLNDEYDEPTGRAGVYFREEGDQQRALLELDGSLIDGRQITARPWGTKCKPQSAAWARIPNTHRG